MSLARPRRLPGLRFEVVAPELQRRLPRTDVAGFVGLSARGPVDVPVPVENTGQFAAIFGGDAVVQLPGHNGGRRSHLGAAVRAFFENGGRRAWIVRVCGPEASRGTITLPGVRRVDGAAEIAAPKLVARSVGAWPDGSSLTAVAEARPIRLRDVVTTAAGVTAALAPEDDLAPGDVVLHRSMNVAWVVTSVSQRSIATHTDAAAPDRDVTGLPAWRLPKSGPALRTTYGDLPGAAEVITLGLRADDGSAIAGLGFHPNHPRYWGHLPTDEDLFGATDEAPLGAAQRATERSALRAQVADPRFPWAASDLPDGAWELPGRELLDDGAERALADDSAAPAWTRDGLTRSSRTWFLDPDLIGASEPALPAAIDALTSLATTPRRLRGAHALWPIDEISLVSLPDAPQAPWHVVPSSASKQVLPTDGGFATCAETALPRPIWLPQNGGTTFIDWRAEPPGTAVRWRVERSADGTFSPPELLAIALNSQLTVPGGNQGYFRVRAETDAETGPWSATLHVTHRAGHLDAPKAAPSLAAVQHDLLRMCAARGDLVAVLSLPDSIDGNTPADLGDLSTLSGTSAPLTGSERRALSYGAVYHPWLWAQDASGPRRVPPDGAICGIFAAKSLAGGAWLVPANTPIRGVTGPVTHTADPVWIQTDARINLIRREAHGTVALGEATLADDGDEVTSVAVRRLLALLRRLALREGQALVFEPNAPAFRRAVKSAFDAWLTEMFRGGAFAGRTADEGFRVEVDAGNADLGRFQVDLRVAPSRPLAFLTVRLVRTDTGARAVEAV